MITLGGQLSAADYDAFKAALAAQLPNVQIQTINVAGRFCVHGNMADDDIVAIRLIYDNHRSTPQFDLMTYQARERRQRQTHNARMKRSAMAMRFWR